MYKLYIAELQKLLAEKADPNVKAWWENYVKQSAPFIGVKMPIIRAALHKWHGDYVDGNLDDAQQLDLALALITEQYTEEKLSGTLFLQEILLPKGSVTCEKDVKRFAELFSNGYIYDWNVCDWFCVKVLGPLIQMEGEGCAIKISKWHNAQNLWQARASLVAFVNLADESSYYPMIELSCQALISRDERFAKTAVGWILRDISKHDRAFVERVITENLGYFSIESLNNAAKYFSKDERKAYKQMLKHA